jgi:uncharacterized protein (UPF0335 family)
VDKNTTPQVVVKQQVEELINNTRRLNHHEEKDLYEYFELQYSNMKVEGKAVPVL